MINPMENPRDIMDSVAFNELAKLPMMPAVELAVGSGETLESQAPTEFPSQDQWQTLKQVDNSNDISKVDASFTGEQLTPEDFETDEFYLGGEGEIYVL